MGPPSSTSAARLSLALLVAVSGVACGPGRLQGEACGCASGRFGAVFEGRCACMPAVDLGLEPTVADQAFHVDPDVAPGGDGSEASPWTEIDWAAVDGALADGAVVVYFSAATADGAEGQVVPDRLDVLRTDTGPHRLVLDGRSRTNTDDSRPSWVDGPGLRAVVPGILTPYEGVFHRVTVRGFEVTGSRDKGIYWRAGDDILLTDLEIHDNRGSPAVNLDYSSRSGHASTGFRFVGNHVYNQRGEGIYIGGSEGEDADSHTFVEVSHNLVHDIDEALGSKDDGINIKDRIGEVRVVGNVVYRTDWGLEVASPGLYAGNLVLDTRREGILINDSFQPVRDLVFEDNLVVRPGHDGLNISLGSGEARGIVVRRTTVHGAREAGLKLGGEHGMEVDVEDFVAVGCAVGLDGWGAGEARVASCALGANEADTDRNLASVSCDAIEAPPLDALAGPDGTWLTEDDPAWLERGARPRSP